MQYAVLLAEIFKKKKSRIFPVVHHNFLCEYQRKQQQRWRLQKQGCCCCGCCCCCCCCSFCCCCYCCCSLLLLLQLCCCCWSFPVSRLRVPLCINLVYKSSAWPCCVWHIFRSGILTVFPSAVFKFFFLYQVIFITISKNTNCEYDRWVVETQLRKLRDT